MTGPRHYGDAEEILVAHLTGLPGGGGVGIELPDDPPPNFVLITELPTGRDDYFTAISHVDVEVFHPDRAACKQFSRVVHNRMMQLRHTYVNGVPVDNVETIAGFGWKYYAPNLSRYLAEYAVATNINAQSL